MPYRIWTRREDDALHALYAEHGDAWSAHLHEYRELLGRSITQCSGRMRSTGVYRLSASVLVRSSDADAPVTQQRAWPAEGVRIFFDDPRAIRDHGSPERLGRPEPMYSPVDCSARWAVAS